MKVTVDLDDATVWSLLEASGTESLEEALEVAVASYIHHAQTDHWSALKDLSFRSDSAEDPTAVEGARTAEAAGATSDAGAESDPGADPDPDAP